MKRHLITDCSGLPLAVVLIDTNANDGVPFEELLDDIPPIDGKMGRPRRGRTSPMLTRSRTTAIIGRSASSRDRSPHCDVGHGDQPEAGPTPLGHRVHLRPGNRYRRLVTCYERRSDIHHAFTSLAR